jgi:hypothetical protein
MSLLPVASDALFHAILQVLLDSARPYPQRVSGYPHPIGKFFPVIYFGPALMFVICQYQFPILSRKFLHALFEALVSQIGLFRRVGGAEDEARRYFASSIPGKPS